MEKKKGKKKVSVIIPFFKRVDWLIEAVQSVLDQTYKDVEIIVVNDGSNEDITEFLKLYGDKIIYIFKENGGAASARNVGLNFSSGDYIAFLDSDDVWLPDKLEKQISFMEDINAVWSHTGYYNWYPEYKKLISKNNFSDYGDVYIKSFISLRAPTSAIVIRKDCLTTHSEFRFPEDMKHSEDGALWSKIAFYYPLALLKEPLVKIRQRGDNCDRLSLIRFYAKASLYKKIQKNEYNNIPLTVKAIYYLYYLGNKFINIIQIHKLISNNYLELLGKVFWAPLFFLERIYLIMIRMKKGGNYNEFKKC